MGFVWALLRAHRDNALSRFVAPSLRTRLLPAGGNLRGLQSVCLVLGRGLSLFGAARPQWGTTTEKHAARSRNVVIAIDVSRSMLATDVRPNRLERTKADVSDLIDSLGNDRCALVAFRRTGVVICPLTSDRGFLRSALEGLSVESAPRGETDLGSAIRAALGALDPAMDDYNAIILISDGGDLRGEAIRNAEEAAKRKIPIFTVGIGDPKAKTALPAEDGRGDQVFHGARVEVSLEEAPLRAIAEVSKGRYVPLATARTTETTLGSIYRKFLRQVAVREQNEEAARTAEHYQVFLGAGIVLLLIGAGLSRGRLWYNTRK